MKKSFKVMVHGYNIVLSLPARSRFRVIYQDIIDSANNNGISYSQETISRLCAVIGCQNGQLIPKIKDIGVMLEKPMVLPADAKNHAPFVIWKILSGDIERQNGKWTHKNGDKAVKYD